MCLWLCDYAHTRSINSKVHDTMLSKDEKNQSFESETTKMKSIE